MATWTGKAGYATKRDKMVTLRSVTFGLMAGAAALIAAGGGANGGGGTGGGVPPPAGTAEIRVMNEKIPAGGTVQVKYMLTTPRPITGGGPKLYNYDFDVFGVAANSPLGDTYGMALPHNGSVAVEVISPSSDYGTSDYPFLTISMGVPSTALAGKQYPMAFPDTVYQSPTGPVTLSNAVPGILTVGGSVSIHGVYPGGGTWPAGTFIKITGTGFSPRTKLTSKTRNSTPFYISPTEMGFYLLAETTLDSTPVTAQNPDGSMATYYSYLRGVKVSDPSRDILKKADPIFQTITHGFATIGPLPAMGAGQFMGLAVQNPTVGPVVVTFYNQRTGASSSVTLPSAGRIVDDLGALMNGLSLQPGDVISVNSTSGVQMIGFTGDEVAYTLKPWLPQF